MPNRRPVTTDPVCQFRSRLGCYEYHQRVFAQGAAISFGRYGERGGGFYRFNPEVVTVTEGRHLPDEGQEQVDRPPTGHSIPPDTCYQHTLISTGKNRPYWVIQGDFNKLPDLSFTGTIRYYPSS